MLVDLHRKILIFPGANNILNRTCKKEAKVKDCKNQAIKIQRNIIGT